MERELCVARLELAPAWRLKKQRKGELVPVKPDSVVHVVDELDRVGESHIGAPSDWSRCIAV
jgi:hypothetical protein